MATHTIEGLDIEDNAIEEMLVYLDELRESGETNMFGARPYLMEAFDLDGPTGAKVLTYWMQTFEERHKA